jgi:hypothetical protein
MKIEQDEKDQTRRLSFSPAIVDHSGLGKFTDFTRQRLPD